MSFHAKSEVFSSKNGLVMSTLYFCTFLYLYFVRTVHTNFYAKFGVSSSKSEHVMLNLGFSAVLLLLRPPVSFVFEGFQIGSPSSSPDINLRVVPTSHDSLGRSYRRPSRPQQIYSFCFSPNLSKIYSSDVHRTTHRHLDM